MLMRSFAVTLKLFSALGFGDLHQRPLEVVKRMKRKKSVMERLQVQRRVREVYMRLVESGRLVPLTGIDQRTRFQKTS